MTDHVERAAVIAAVENAVTCGGLGERAFERIIADDAIAAIKALPATDPAMTDDVKALVALLESGLDWTVNKRAAQALTDLSARVVELEGLVRALTPNGCLPKP
jgi:hypothetical protein